MDTYDIGGSEVKGDASEAISEIQQNRTLLVEKLTAEAPVKPEIVQGLTKIDEVFEHFKPQIDIDFQDSEGVTEKKISTSAILPILGLKESQHKVNSFRILPCKKNNCRKSSNN